MDHEGWQGGRLSVAGFVFHDSNFHADLKWTHHFESGGELVRDLSYWLCCLPWFVHLRRMEPEMALNAFFHQASSSVSSSDPCPLAPFAALACIRSYASESMLQKPGVISPNGNPSTSSERLWVGILRPARG